MTDTTRIFVYDDIHPENNAMLQALYSRSPASVVTHLDKVKASGSGKFMESFYVGYGHASIGDCGTTTIFMENWSMLAAKAIQNHPLYNGQEASTRYLDFAAQPMHNPLPGNPEAAAIQAQWMALYNQYMPVFKEAIAAEHPFNPAEYKSEKAWQSAVNARAFDTLRSLLPLGCTTLFSWTTTLRNARDHLMKLASHPLPEVRTLAKQVFSNLIEKYPHSYRGTETDLDDAYYKPRHDYALAYATADHMQTWSDTQALFGLSADDKAKVQNGEVAVDTSLLDVTGLKAYAGTMLSERPQGASLPQHLKNFGMVRMVSRLDFGSFRDLQRHRGGVAMHVPPLVDNTFGFNAWYLGEFGRLLPDGGKQLVSDIDATLARVEALAKQGHDLALLQYLYPMGLDGAVSLSYTLPQLVYVAELRSQKTVHASLRPWAQQMARWMGQTFPGMALYADHEADSWTAKRGDQDITAKVANSR